MLWVLLLWVSAWPQAARAVFHERSASWFDLPATNPDTYFGYSVTYEPTSKRLVVGAPQGDNIGEIYSCDLSASNATNKCKSLTKETRRSVRGKYQNNKYWLGATVKAGPSYVVTCAPLRLDRPNLEIGGNRTYEVGTFSKCYKYNLATDGYETLRNIEDRTLHATLFEHAMDSFGWSIDVHEDDIIIGGPAMTTGRVEKFMRNKHIPFSLTGYTDATTNEGRYPKINYNFGYSVVVGHFITRRTASKSYAIGSPYGNVGRGKVSFYTFANNGPHPNDKLRSREDLVTDDENAVGSMFGAALCAARLTAGSAHTTLLVGAPTHARHDKNEVNRGAVYFYSPASTLPLKELKRKLVGQRDGGLFGSAIAALGDYNGDGLDEIAIAAPYANLGAGVVYIYSSKDINSISPNIKFSQEIYPKEDLVMSFGFSLSKVEDFDNNGCNELAIGAPVSNRVMLLSCIASVTIKVRADIPEDLSLRDDNPSRTEEHFNFQSCLDVTFPTKPKLISAKFKVTVKLIHPNVTLQASDQSYEVLVQRTDKPICRNITASAPKDGYYQFPVDYTIRAEQLYPPEQTMVEFNASNVAVSDRSVMSVSDSFSLNECKNKTNCLPVLKLAKSISAQSVYELGSTETITLTTSVKNEGESAYGACLRVAVAVDANADEPEDVSSKYVGVTEVPRGCVRVDERTDKLICRPFGVLRSEDQAWVTAIQFDTSRLTSEQTFMNISTDLYSDCNQANHDFKSDLIPLSVDFSKISVKGMTDAGVSNAVNMSKNDAEGKQFVHSYTITSEGLTNWADIKIKVVIEKRNYIEYSSAYLATGSGPGLKCSEITNGIEFNCVIPKLNSNEPAKITLPMMIISPELLDTAISDKVNTLTSSIVLEVNGKTRQDSVTTTFNLFGKVAIWIIVVASLVALLILIIFFLVLKKRGFFKREKKTNLAQARQSVRRQTMMRHTMIDGVHAPAGSDRRSLLASMPHETADEAAARDTRVRLDSNATRNKTS